MSRILRRPMFRGGRVDARGTGIASGLGYNNGGRVGFDNGGLSLEQQKNLANYQSNRRSNKKFTYDSIRDRMQAYYDNLYLRGMNEGDIDMGLQISPNMSPDDIAEANYFEQTPKKFEEDFFSGIIGGTNYNDIMKNLSSGAKLAGEENLYIKPSEEIIPSESEENGSNKLTEGGGLPEKTKAEKLEEYQKMFEEAYGTGRGEDISNMLLSFAGKALKPEATVKSSFGEFFEEEAKRPSERKKYKDAATTAAINAYLTGQKDYDSMMKQMKLIQYGNRDKITVASEAANLKGKDWESALSIVQDRYRGTKKRDSFLIVSETLKGVFGKPVDQKKGELGEIQEEDLIEGFTILTTKAGKIILEKIDGVIKKRPDLVI